MYPLLRNDFNWSSTKTTSWTLLIASKSVQSPRSQTNRRTLFSFSDRAAVSFLTGIKKVRVFSTSSAP